MVKKESRKENRQIEKNKKVRVRESTEVSCLNHIDFWSQRSESHYFCVVAEEFHSSLAKCFLNFNSFHFLLSHIKSTAANVYFVRKR